MLKGYKPISVATTHAPAWGRTQREPTISQQLQLTPPRGGEPVPALNSPLHSMLQLTPPRGGEPVSNQFFADIYVLQLTPP